MPAAEARRPPAIVPRSSVGRRGHDRKGTAVTAPQLPGRLGQPDLTLADDPRADPRLVAAFEQFGLAGRTEPAPVGSDAPIEAVLDYIAAAEEGFEGLFAVIASGAPAVEGVERSVEKIQGVDGNDITLFIHRPANAEGELPGVLHIHGGGMVLLAAEGPLYARWRDSLAAAGTVVVGVEFRNGAGRLGPHPFPAGLDDCASALAWVAAHRGELGIGKLVVSGESGGGNLTLATALRAKRDGTIGEIAGVYAMCPYISGSWANPPATLTSLFENDGYFLDVSMMGVLARAYDPDGAHADDPLAWPLQAGPDDLADLPPHVISVNQLDPLRDEGLAYARKLLDAGVSAVSRTVNGTTHAGDMIGLGAMADVHDATIRDITGFARSL